MLRLVLHFFALALVTSSVRGEIRISLNSGQFPGSWDVRNDSSSERIPANVPGGIYSDLNLVEDLFYRQNDHEFRWVGYENWTFETTFELAPQILNMTTVNLVFHGIDTVGDVYLNGVKIRSVDNMFIKHIIPIKTIAKEGNNTLEVRLKSPVLAAKEAADAHLYDIPPDCPAPEQQGECHINFLRKMQASFSWDWGLAAPSAGIWKPVEIEAYNTALVRDIVGTVTKNGSYYIIDASCHLESESDDSEWGSYSLSIGWEAPDSYRKVFTRENLLKTQVKSSVYVYQATFEAFEDQISVWWPNGYGDQPIYQLYCIFETINLDDDDNEKSSISTNIGFRSVELVQEEVQEGNFPNLGLSFYFKVNDVPIFAKGANWIPGHILPELSYNEKMIRQLLQSAKDANMNMLRVWGGGVYESDLFYQVADELGIMIWQDMMFAVALYPSTQNYLESVTEEVTQQVRRLATHPSVAVWAGNNENEAAITGNWFNIQNNTDQYISDYILLYVLVIKSIVESEDASRSYVISSPSNGLKTEQDGYISSDPYSPLYGDVHYYNYDNDPRNTSLYPNTRFASEYGFQGMPSFKSISKVSEPEDWNLNSEFTIFRQHHPQGYEQMTKLMKYFLPLPEDDGSEEFYKTFIYYSQISQAIATKTESEKYRRDRSTLTDTNEGLTMGALYWQLNDVWHAPTWASIEFGGRWKMLHYYAVKFFAPVIVVPDLSPNGELRIFGVSDLLTDVEYGLTGVLYSWDSYAPKAAILGRGILANSSSSILNSFNLSDFLAESDCEVTTCFLQITLSGDGFQSENFFYPSSFSDVTNLRPANISATVTRDENTNEIVVNLETDGIAPFVWLETDEEGIFSDNGFTLVSTTAQVTFSNRGEEVDIDKFKETLEVRSLLK